MPCATHDEWGQEAGVAEGHPALEIAGVQGTRPRGVVARKQYFVRHPAYEATRAAWLVVFPTTGRSILPE